MAATRNREAVAAAVQRGGRFPKTARLLRHADFDRVYRNGRRYQRWLSPALPPACRYVPTCSQYAADAVERYGAARGALKALWRVLRCHPLAKGGFDPA